MIDIITEASSQREKDILIVQNLDISRTDVSNAVALI